MEGGFKKVIQNILNRWSGLKLSVEHQSGGRQSKERALYLIEYINHVLVSNNNVECEELEDLITEYMDAEFRTILEDESVPEISRTLLRLYQIYQSGNEEVLLQELNKLPSCEIWLDAFVPTSSATHVVEEDSGDSSDSDTHPDAHEEPMDCEWTQVSYKKKR